jgi:hypothetical protein
MTCKGLHCNGCSGGGRGAAVVLIVLVLVVMIGKAVSKAVQHAWHVLAVVLEVVVIALAVSVVVLVCWGLIHLGLRIHRWHAARARGRVLFPAVIKATLLPAKAHAIEAPRAQLTSEGVDLERGFRPSPPSN